MSYTIKLWDLWVRIEKSINAYLAPKVRRVLVKRNEAYADAFLKEWREKGGGSSPWIPDYSLNRSKKCNHLKGGSGRRKVVAGRDYNLAQHTFADGRTKIWCMYNCGLQAWNGDKQFNNLQELLDRSSNKPSSTERVFDSKLYEDKTCIKVVCADRMD